MKRLVVSLVALLLASGAASAQDKVTLCGTGDSQALLRAVGAAFEKANPGTTVVVPDSVGSDGGVKAAAARECDFGRVARALKEQENSLGLTYKVFAFSPVVFVVDPQVGVENLTAKQIVAVYSGKATTWTEVGGRGGVITVVGREAKDSSRGELNRKLEGFKAVESPVGLTAGTTPEAVELLAKSRSAIGYLPATMARNLPLKVIKVDGVAPSAANVVQGTYGIATPFGLVWKGELSAVASRFYQFLSGPEGRKLMIDAGVVPAGML
jgi:phosphate transport system substrate-binding protein